MAHEPKLQVFKLYLKPYQSVNHRTFRNLLEVKYGSDLSITEAYKAFFSDFISSIDNAYHRSEKRKKAIGLKSKGDGEENRSLKIRTNRNVIQGTIKGGRYGQNRAIGDLDRPDGETEDLRGNNIVLDDFYFLLYTPLNSEKAVLLLQSYSDDTIKDVFVNFVRRSLSVPQAFYNAIVSDFCPSYIQQEFLENSIIKEMTFRQDVLISDVEESESIQTKDFKVEIRITAKNEGEDLASFPVMRKLFGQFKFRTSKNKNISLEDFNTKKGTLTSDGHQSTFELDSDLDVKPTIYLKKRIKLQADGSPNWKSLEQYCDELLETIKPEVYPENEIRG